MSLSLHDLNTASADGFAAALDGVYEHSPWIAARAAAQRPFATPAALLKAVDTASVAAELDGATNLAREREVRDVPAVWVPGAGDGPDRVFHGDDELTAAAAAVGKGVPAP